jgi:valyl-tRNA synthetase
VTLYYTDVSFMQENAALIKRLARLQDVTEVKDGTGLYLTETPYRCWLDIDQRTAQAYLKELEGKQAAQESLIKQLEGRLANDSYTKNAPHHIVAQTKDQLTEAKAQLEKLAQEHARFSR